MVESHPPRARLHEEGVLLGADSISSGDQWRGALGISLPTGARGLRITVLFLISHLSVSDLLLLLLADLLFHAGLIFLHVVGLLLQHPAVLDEVLKLCNRPLYLVEGGLQGIQPMLQLSARWRIGGHLHGPRHGIKLIT